MEGKLREEIEGIRPKDVTLLKQGAEAVSVILAKVHLL